MNRGATVAIFLLLAIAILGGVHFYLWARLVRDPGLAEPWRRVVTVALVNLAVGRRSFRPSLYGKVATATYLMACVAVLFFNYLGRRSAVVDIAIWLSLLMTLVSGIHYIWHAARVINTPGDTKT